VKGVIAGCDANQEWLLPWWWEHYSKHNSYPVAFFDFGMSEKAIAWCKAIGQYVKLPQNPNFLKEPSLKLRAQFGNRDESAVRNLRLAWFQKPFACLHTPFPLTCWIDLDCEVKGDIEPLFQTVKDEDEIALVPEPEYVQKKLCELGTIDQGETSYNDGVIAFRKGAKIIDQWIDVSTHQNDEFLGDSETLTRTIYLHRPALKELPSIYNWKMNQGPNPESLINHYISTMKLQILLGRVS
jgi:hypothetical protein